jgi:hypothetical protein
MLEVAFTAGVSPYAARAAYLHRHDLVFDILHAYVDALHEYVGAADDAHEGVMPIMRMEAMIKALLDGIHDHRDAHQVMCAALPILKDSEREALGYQLRMLSYRLRVSLIAALPVLAEAPHFQAPLVQSLLGMATHTPNWLKEDGPLDRTAYARVITTSILEGGRVMLARQDQHQGANP